MTSKKQKVYEELKYQIITSGLAPGEPLKDKEIMEQYGIGRTPLRDVFLQLQNEGLINRVHRSGTWVAPMDFNQLREISEIRIGLEGMAGELAAQRITDERIGELEAILEKVRALEEADELDNAVLLRYEFEFHDVIYSSIGNAQLEKLLRDYQGVGARFWHSLVFSNEQMLSQIESQRTLLEAIKRRDREASRTIAANHIRDVLVVIEQRLAVMGGPGAVHIA
jgi:DNA-binding GntR family transcriptional regulator